MIETIILTSLNLLSLLIGLKIGQKSSHGREITLNPIKAIRNDISESKERKEQDLKKRQFNTSLRNIDNYNGSGLGQEQIPKD